MKSKVALHDWIENGDLLVNHIQNGVARELYTQELANVVLRRLEGIEQELTDAFILDAQERKANV